MSDKLKKEGLDVETTGHVWDGDLQEYNNPLPRWWLFSFYGTVIFSLIYWVLYPTWPLPNSWTKGSKRYELTMADGETKKIVPWSSRTYMAHELQTSSAAKIRNEKFAQLMSLSNEEILTKPEMIDFSRQSGKVLFADNCAICHGAGAEGSIGAYPNLTDNNWLWGGSLTEIEKTITGGRSGNMTPAVHLTQDELSDVARFALTLSQNHKLDDATERGREIYAGKGACISCHMPDGTGNKISGSANLTDQIWELVDIPSVKTEQERVELLIPHIEQGVVPGRSIREMPAWKGRLTAGEIRALAIYVHTLGGGE